MSCKFPMRAARAITATEVEPITLRWWPCECNRWLLVGPNTWTWLTEQFGRAFRGES